MSGECHINGPACKSNNHNSIKRYQLTDSFSLTKVRAFHSVYLYYSIFQTCLLFTGSSSSSSSCLHISHTSLIW